MTGTHSSAPVFFPLLLGLTALADEASVGESLADGEEFAGESAQGARIRRPRRGRDGADTMLAFGFADNLEIGAVARIVATNAVASGQDALGAYFAYRAGAQVADLVDVGEDLGVLLVKDGTGVAECDEAPCLCTFSCKHRRLVQSGGRRIFRQPSIEGGRITLMF